MVPVRDGSEVLAACLDALGAQEGVRREVVVVDNGSQDGTADLARGHPAVSAVVHEPQPGSYAARNAGIAVASAEVLAFTDADCVPDPGWLAAGLAAVAAGADLVGGEVVSLPSDRPTTWERYDRATYLRQSRHVAAESFAATANLFVRRAVIEAVGPFDAGLRSSGDLELCRRAVAAGFTIVHAGDAVVRHRPRTTLRATWALHRRLGAGWRDLARRGERPPAWRDPALRIRLGTVVDEVAADGPPLRRRHLAPVHAVAMLARWTGRLVG